MSVYSIDFSEPLASGFEIPAGGFNGPGGAAANTSLRLYGRGALEWGESVNEDLVRLTENFASATPPPNPISGQLWTEVRLYHFDGADYWRFDPDGADWEATPLVAPTVTSLPVIGPSTPVGQYCVYNGVLYGLYVKSPESVASWQPRSFSSGATRPTKPEQVLKVYDKFNNMWVAPQSVTVATTAGAPTAPTPGMLWYNPDDKTLSVWDAAVPGWQVITSSGSATAGDLNMGNFGVTNLADPVNPQDAATKNYVDTTTVPLAGGVTMTGLLVLSGDPTVALGAATKQYVDTSIATALSGSGTTASTFVNPISSVTYNAGDIAIQAGKIYIALDAGTSTVPGGNWKQVWPATYS